MDLGSFGRFRVSTARSVEPAKSPLGYSENAPGAGTNGPILGTIAEQSAHKGARGQKRRHGVTALRALDLRVAPE
jgi:hypothetical protein